MCSRIRKGKDILLICESSLDLKAPGLRATQAPWVGHARVETFIAQWGLVSNLMAHPECDEFWEPDTAALAAGSVPINYRALEQGHWFPVGSRALVFAVLTVDTRYHKAGECLCVTRAARTPDEQAVHSRFPVSVPNQVLTTPERWLSALQSLIQTGGYP
mgnify:CR=1 FL=1